MLALVPLRGRDELVAQVFAPAIQRLWPEYAMHDPAAELYYAEPHFTACLDAAFALVEPERPDVAVGRAFAVAFAWEGVRGRATLPDTRHTIC